MSRSSRHIPQGRGVGCPPSKLYCSFVIKEFGCSAPLPPTHRVVVLGGRWGRCLWHGEGLGGCEAPPPKKGLWVPLEGWVSLPGDMELPVAAVPGGAGCQRSKFTPTVLCVCIVKVSWNPSECRPTMDPLDH